MPHLELHARAKINITLDVLRKRPDGYHELVMIMQTVGLHDLVRIGTGRGDGAIRLSTNLSYLPTDRKNIAFKAAELFFDRTGVQNDGISIDIRKNIPVAAGLAGGSTDAAAVLRGLNTLFGAGLNLQALMEIGKEIGSDVPYCIAGGTALATGRGEVLKPLSPMPRCPVVLVKPPFSLSTAKVYQSVACEKIRMHPDTEGAVRAIERKKPCGGRAPHVQRARVFRGVRRNRRHQGGASGFGRAGGDHERKRSVGIRAFS